MDLKSGAGSRRAGEEPTEKTDALLRSADAELPRAYFALVPGCLPAGAKVWSKKSLPEERYARTSLQITFEFRGAVPVDETNRCS
jgi:hypothetical protein